MRKNVKVGNNSSTRINDGVNLNLKREKKALEVN